MTRPLACPYICIQTNVETTSAILIKLWLELLLALELLGAEILSIELIFEIANGDVDYFFLVLIVDVRYER